MVQRVHHQCRRDFARRDPIWREQPSYRRILLQGSGEGASGGGRDRSARRGRSAVHQGSARRLIYEHDPEKWEPVFRKDHAQTKGHRRRGAMPVYTVHAPVTTNAGVRATDRFAFVRDGFHVWAALAGVLWLAWHRLWLALIGWIVVIA